MAVTRPIWQWDERIQRGTDYASVAEVRAYDVQMAALRDIAAETERIFALLGLSDDDVLLEVGTGTGAFSRAASRRCQKVIALDVSRAMLTYASQRAEEEHLDNIVFQEAGFLTYEHQGEPLSAVVSQLALHHLPDAWKLVALRRVAGFVRGGGGLYLTDIVFPDRAERDWSSYFQELVDSMPEGSRAQMACHIREEFSAFDWMMREILVRAGFTLESAELEGGFLGHYLCRKS
jgi:putative AdoMet-dependent methyltransferase